MSSTWEEMVARGVSAMITTVSPVIYVADPAAGAIITLGSKILSGLVAAEPEAVALVNQIMSGTPPTPAQLAAYAASYEAAYQQLNDDIAAKLATAT